MTTRYDVSEVPLQGGYVAKQCPVRAQNDALQPCEPLPPSPALGRRFKLGREFEAEVFAVVQSGAPQSVTIEGSTPEEKEAATTSSINQGVEIILGGRLRADNVGRRVGKPDLLIRTGGTGDPRYRAVDVKHHQALGNLDKVPARCSSLGTPGWEDSLEDHEHSPRKHRGDLLQLAHYQRMLEAAGIAAEDGRWAAIIGVEGTIVWHDLDAPIWLTPSSSGKQKRRSTMEVYDFEFDFRLDIIAVANEHLSDPSIDPLLVPVRISECAECPWWVHCRPILEEGAGDVSLVPKVGWRQWKALQERGVYDRRQLAQLDFRTAKLVAGGVDVPSVLAAAGASDPSTPISELVGGKRPAKVALLEQAGIATAADALALSPATASLYGAGLSSLPAQIDLARAALGSEPVYQRRGIGALNVPRADLEVDLDLENTEEGVYLWGALVTDRAGLGIEGGYRVFVTWEPMTREAEVETFARMWEWLNGLRRQVHDRAHSFAVYCYNETVEAGHSRRLAAGTEMEDEVEELISSDEWTDMMKVFDSQLITGGSHGLKAVAPLAGHGWTVEDAGGAESMLRYDLAVGASDADAREQAQRWLLDYNREDVEATLALREWLDTDGDSIKKIEDL